MPNGLAMTCGLVGGLGLFLYGMQLMADGLQKTAGDRLRKLLEALTRTPLIGMLVGAIVTMLIQSSSATSVMVVGFVNAGLMSLEQAISVLLGAAVGTTVTAFIVSLRLSDLALPAIGLGFLLTIIGKKKSTRFIGQAILGFGLLFLGLTVMGDAMKPLQHSVFFRSMMLNFCKYPVLGVLAGAIFTAIMQSSSATTGLIVTLAAQGLLDLQSAFSLVLGANIGTIVTALLASIPMKLTAKRAAVSHLIFKVIGVVIFVIAFRPFVALAALTHPDVARQVANAHIMFNVINALLFLPFISALARLVQRLLPGEDTTEQLRALYLDKNLLNTPSVALGQATKELVRMGNLTTSMLNDALQAFRNNDDSKLSDIAQIEDVIDQLERDIVDYLVQLSQASLSSEQSERLNALLHVSNDLERIGDHAQNVADLASYKVSHRLPLSAEAEQELADMSKQVSSLVERSVEILTSGDRLAAERIILDESNIDLLEKSLRRQHIKRLNAGICFPASGIVYLDLISNLERIADHANNIAQALVGIGKNQEPAD
ncbi:MAG: Na/Pi cotransporter family protein [Firmicutes bacterium]|nr:Na/Pi cotransporter family protein [Bacillota bacterium]